MDTIIYNNVIECSKWDTLDSAKTGRLSQLNVIDKRQIKYDVMYTFS